MILAFANNNFRRNMEFIKVGEFSEFWIYAEKKEQKCSLDEKSRYGVEYKTVFNNVSALQIRELKFHDGTFFYDVQVDAATDKKGMYAYPTYFKTFEEAKEFVVKNTEKYCKKILI